MNELGSKPLSQLSSPRSGDELALPHCKMLAIPSRVVCGS
jgi:hypothetical protein